MNCPPTELDVKMGGGGGGKVQAWTLGSNFFNILE